METERGDVEVFDELEDVGFVEWRFRCWNPIDTVQCVCGAPGLDESAERVVGGQVGVSWKRLLCDGACGVVRRQQPVLEAFTVVGNPGHHRNWVFHDLKRYGTYEILRNINFSFNFLHEKGWKRGREVLGELV